MKPVSVNFHIWKPCNEACKFCFATFGDVPGHLTSADAVRVVRLLREAGCEKINFAGGEPTLCAEGLGPVMEDNDAMMSSYVMVDPLGRFYGNAAGRYVYSDPILSVGVAVALAQVGWQPDRFVDRGGAYDWSARRERRLLSLRRR